MADAPDRPAAAAGDAAAHAVPATTLLPPPSSGETYRPVSPLAIIGLSVSILYGLLLSIGTIASLFSRSPFLLPTWTILIPLGTLFLCWVARVQIQASEGTLGGMPLVQWGIGLTLLFGLTYWPYVAATAIAVRQQAASTAEQWMTLLRESGKDGTFDQTKFDQAFVMTLQPPGLPRIDDADWPKKVVNDYDVNRTEATAPGPYTLLSDSELTRSLQEGGPDSRFSLVDVEEWTEKDSGYLVRLRYHIQTPYAEFDWIVTTRGIWPRDSTRRQWYVVNNESGPARDGSIRLTSQGAERDRWAKDPRFGAVAFIRRWAELISAGDFERAFQATMTAEQREQMHRAAAVAVMAGPIGIWHPPEVRKIFAARGDAQNAVTFVKARGYYAEADVDKKVDELIQLGLVRSGKPPVRFAPYQSAPLHDVNDRTVTLRYGVEIVAAPDVIANARIVVQADRQALEKGQSDLVWRIVAVELLRARAMAERRGPQPPARPMG
jgi:hypothetical protein